MKTILGAIALTLSVPAMAQTAPAADPLPCQAAQGQQPGNLVMEDMHKSCREMKRHEKMLRKAKAEAESIEAEVNGNGHQGHNH